MAPTNIAVTIKKDGTYMFNGKKSEKSKINQLVNSELTKADDVTVNDATLTIIAEKGVEWKSIYELMEIANKNKMRAIIATQPKKS
ncbi:MAG: hypothetical protein R2771_07495 [Saprospiraceae bacterium]